MVFLIIVVEYLIYCCWFGLLCYLAKSAVVINNIIYNVIVLYCIACRSSTQIGQQKAVESQTVHTQAAKEGRKAGTKLQNPQERRQTKSQSSISRHGSRNRSP